MHPMPACCAGRRKLTGGSHPWCIIDLHSKCPDSVSNELRAAFRLFFADAGACAGRIRVALEKLMNHLGVQRRKKGSKGKSYDLSLHQRIEIYANATPELRDQLLAIKWLGNTGSHEGQIVRDDVLSGFEVLEHVIGEILDRRAAKVKELAKQLTKKHAGSPRKR